MKRRRVIHTSKASESGVKTAILEDGSILKAKITTGKNVVDKTVKRGYLKHDELNNFLVIHVINKMLSGRDKASDVSKAVVMWDDWSEKGILTKEQKKNIKTASTYLKKFTDDVFENNLDVKTKDTVVRKSANWAFRLMDDYTVKRLYNMLNTRKEVSLSTDEFYDLIESKMHISCKGCTKNRCECDFHEFLESKFVPPMNEKINGEYECNCEYSYK